MQDSHLILHNEKKLCVIPARGGSKRIPHKNIRKFCGKPIIAYSIEAALESGLFDEVMVSTDDREIASIAKNYGASIPFMRSAETSDDFATTVDVLCEVVEEYKHRGCIFDIICCVYATAPFVRAKDLKHAIDLIESSGMDMVQPVVEFDFPPQRAFKFCDSSLSYWMPEWCNTRSQDLPSLYHDAGQFYVYKVNSLVNDDRTRCPLILNRARVQDIDDEMDWLLAELKFQFLMGGN